MRFSLKPYLLAGVIVSAFAPPVSASTDFKNIVGRATVLAGDLIQIGLMRIELFGIDAPEVSQTCIRNGKFWPCGQAAIDHLRSFIGKAEVTCRLSNTRSVTIGRGKCRVYGLDLSAELATHGLALVNPKGPRDYWLNHLDGRSHSVGMWGSVYVAPWEWRQGKRAVEWINDLNGCAIKAFVDGTQNKVYMMPNNPQFSATRISELNQGRWFCEEEGAIKAGYRKSN